MPLYNNTSSIEKNYRDLSAWEFVDISISLMFTCLSILGNILIIFSILISNDLRNIPNIFLGNLAISDLLLTLLFSSHYEVSVIFNISPFSGCVIPVWFAVLCTSESITTQLLLAVNRYIIICQGTALYNRVFTGRYIAIMLSITWLYNILWGNIFVTFMDSNFNTIFKVCLYSFNLMGCFLYLLFILIVLLPAVSVIGVCYFKIFRKIQDSQINLHKMKDKGSSTSVDRRLLDNIKVTKTLLFTYCIFIGSFLPTALLFPLSFFVNLPSALLRVCILVPISHTIWNSIICGYTNKKFREGYIKILTCGTKQNKVTASSESK